MSVLIHSVCYKALIDPNSRRSFLPYPLLSRVRVKDYDSDYSGSDSDSECSCSDCSNNDNDNHMQKQNQNKIGLGAAPSPKPISPVSAPVTTSYLGQNYTCIVRFRTAEPSNKATEEIIILGIDWFNKFRNLFMVFGHPIPLPHPMCFVLEHYTACEFHFNFLFLFSPSFNDILDGVLSIANRNHRLIPSADYDDDPEDEFAADEEDDSSQWRVQAQSTMGHFIPVYQEQVT
jgi:hypothetical protein